MADEVEVEEQEGPKTIELWNFCNGAAAVYFQELLAKVMANIQDEQTPALATRSFTLKFEFKAKEDRTQVFTKVLPSLSVPSIMPESSQMFIGKDSNDVLIAVPEDPRQMKIFAASKPAPVKAPITFGVPAAK